MNIQRGQDLAAADSSCPWERLHCVAKTKGGKIEGERGSKESGGPAVTPGGPDEMNMVSDGGENLSGERKRESF